MADRICTVDGCSYQGRRKGMCIRHYNQARAGVPFTNRPVAHRFVAHAVATRDRTTGCWEDWPYSFNTAGRPWLGYAGRTMNVSRFVRYLEDGEWPVCACHHCDNPKCWNPDHIYAGDQLSNITDMINRGRAGWQR